MDLNTLARMIDLSCVRADNTLAELKRMVDMAKKHKFICCFAMPCYTGWLVNELRDEVTVNVGGAVGFPSGADLTESKVLTASRLVSIGCAELDMVINISALKSGDYALVYDDIKQVQNAADGRALKTILEVAYLSEEEIKRACDIALRAGASYIKTGTGWADKPTTVEHINLIKQCVGTCAKIKAAGGIRSLRTIREMTQAGCSRFGIGVNTAAAILREAEGCAD